MTKKIVTFTPAEHGEITPEGTKVFIEPDSLNDKLLKLCALHKNIGAKNALMIDVDYEELNEANMLQSELGEALWRLEDLMK